MALDPAASILDEGQRFRLGQAEPLRHLFQTAQLAQGEVRSIDVATVFRDFDDYWSPFLGGQGLRSRNWGLFQRGHCYDPRCPFILYSGVCRMVS